MTTKLPPDAPAERSLISTPSGELTHFQDAFIDAFIASGGKREQSAIEAGYSEASAAQMASRLLKHDVVMTELYRRTRLHMASMAPAALKQLETLATEAKSERIRREASSDLLDRVGLSAPTRVEHMTAGELKVTIDLGG